MLPSTSEVKGFCHLELFREAKLAERRRLEAQLMFNSNESVVRNGTLIGLWKERSRLSDQKSASLQAAEAKDARLSALAVEIDKAQSDFDAARAQVNNVEYRLHYLDQGWGHCQPTAMFLLESATIVHLFDNNWTSRVPCVGNLEKLRGVFDYRGFRVFAFIRPHDCRLSLLNEAWDELSKSERMAVQNA